MANPTVKSTIPQAANVKAALWVSPDVEGGSGAWDAKNGVRYAPWGTLSSVALGATGINGLSAPGGTNCGIALGLVSGHTTTPFDITGTQFTLVVCVSAAGSSVFIQNRGTYTPRDGWSLGVESTSYLMGRLDPLTVANGGASSLTANATCIYALTYDGANSKLYKNGTLIQTQANTASLSYATVSRRAALFNNYQSFGGSAGAQKIFGAVVYDKALTLEEVQSFGISTAEADAGSFHAAAFDFGGSGSTDATADGVTLTGTATLTPGTATGGAGAVDATADGVTLTGTATLTPGTATGGASGSFVSSPMYSSGILQTSVALDWTWYPGAIGAAPTATLVHGSGTTATDGTLTMPGLPAGTGFYMAEGLDLNGEVLVALEYGAVT